MFKNLIKPLAFMGENIKLTLLFLLCFSILFTAPLAIDTYIEEAVYYTARFIIT